MKKEFKKLIEDYVNGLLDTGGQTLDQLEYGVEYIISDYIEKYIENEDGEDVDNPEFFKAVKDVCNTIKNDRRLYVWSADIYSYDGNIVTLNEPYICSDKYDNPFDDINREL